MKRGVEAASSGDLGEESWNAHAWEVTGRLPRGSVEGVLPCSRLIVAGRDGEGFYESFFGGRGGTHDATEERGYYIKFDPGPDWGSESCAVNRTIKAGPGFLHSPTDSHGTLQLEQECGVHCFRVRESDALEVSDFLLDMGNRDAHGFLRVGLATYPGYGSYKKVQVDRWDKKKAPAVQESFTSMVEPSSLHFLMERIPGLAKVVRHVFDQLQIDFVEEYSFLKGLHFLVQADPHVRLRV